jgi:glucose/arabinose dehydrogenase
VSVAGDIRLIKVRLLPDISPQLEVKRVGTLTGVFGEAGGKVQDVFTKRDGSVLVSFNTADQRKCASLKLDEVIFNKTFDALQQNTLYQTTPCILPPYVLFESGGRIEENNDGDILLSIGTMGRDDQVVKQNSDFGKIIKISSGTVHEIARGFRNPQGLFIDLESNRLYSTDHGPRGGDELNIVEEGGNYGWPFETYGFPYDEDTEHEPFSKGAITYGRHDRFKKPLFAFVPDIAIGQIAKIPIESYEFPNWIGDFLVAAMHDRSLYRIRIEDNRVVYVEPIKLSRIRDFIIASDGVIVASSNEGLIILRRAVEVRG